MKTNFLAVALCAVTGAAFCAEPVKLEVHEWGTFTIVSGSDGMPLRWYQPERFLAELPSFVQHNVTVGGKAGPGVPTLGSGRISQGGDLVRMETPVIYFYPEKPMEVTVAVDFQQGRLTEWFPAPGNPFGTGTVKWMGTLLAPDNADAAKMIPKVEGARGAHYAHAREVPAAWYYHSVPCNPPQPGDTAALPYEKFIFYRGAGNAIPPLQANAREGGQMKLMRFDQSGPPVVAFALRVQGDQAHWARMPDLPSRGVDYTSPAPVSVTRLEGEPRSIKQATAELGAAIIKELIAAGLSADEAKAMVATWSDSWFQENGSRIFVLLPRAWVDSVLPLTITPKPEKITRVFVGRFETFSPEQEKTLLSVLAPGDKNGASPVEQFRNLRLGRFANAALQRTKDLLELDADVQFESLQKASALSLPPPPDNAV